MYPITIKYCLCNHVRLYLYIILLSTVQPHHASNRICAPHGSMRYSEPRTRSAAGMPGSCAMYVSSFHSRRISSIQEGAMLAALPCAPWLSSGRHRSSTTRVVDDRWRPELSRESTLSTHGMCAAARSSPPSTRVARGPSAPPVVPRRPPRPAHPPLDQRRSGGATGAPAPNVARTRR